MKKSEFHIRVTRGTGPGGQHKNKTETCAIVTHIATGLQEKCQDTRYKLRNIEIAKDRLIVRIEKLKEDIKNEKRNNLRKELISNPKTVRTYNFPRSQVTDHRTKKKYNIDKFLDGDIDFCEINADIALVNQDSRGV